MGGGDLNLKKSWHPHTMKNQEKVWKAEQAKNQEEQKLNDLKREIAEEKNREDLKRIGQASGVLQKNDSDKKLEWMYKSSTDLINREEYLLGRSVDKSFELLQAEEQRKSQNVVGVKAPVNHVEHECIPFSIRTYRNLESNEQVDLQRKVLEDPLMLIKQREMESRRKLLENPVKLKELHRILKTEQELRKVKEGSSKKAKKSKKSKKSKKKRKKSKRGASTSDSSSDSESNSSASGKDLDKELEKRYTKLLNREEELSGLNITKLLDAKYETISKELDKAVKSKESSKRSYKSRSNSSERGTSRRPRNDSRQERKNYSPEERHEQRRRNDPSVKRRETRHSRSRSRTPTRNKNKMDSQTHQKRKHRRSRTRSRSRLPPKRSSTQTPHAKSHSSTSTKNNSTSSSSSKLSAEDKEKRLREMMQNAAWRDVERTKTVHKHREEYAREEEQIRAHQFDKEFINKEVKKAISSQHSVGSRIRSNINNIQRTSAALNANFARK